MAKPRIRSSGLQHRVMEILGKKPTKKRRRVIKHAVAKKIYHDDYKGYGKHPAGKRRKSK